jgi:DNA polymerase III delta subunit
MPVDNALGFLRNLESNRPLPDAIVVFGPHGFLRETVVSAIATRLTKQSFQYRSFQIGAGGDFAGALDELGAADLFAAKRLVVCRVLKSHRDRGGGEEAAEDEEAAPSRAAPAGGEAALAEAIEHGTAPNHLLLVYERDNLPARVRKAAERSSALVGCLRPFDNQVPDYARSFARVRSLKLSSDAADFLAARHAGDLSAIANALDKAALASDGDKPLGPDDFGEPGSRRMPDIFEIADSVARGRAAGALGQIDRALAFGRDPIEILAVEVIPVMRRMMIAASMLARRRGTGEIAAAIGGSPTSGLVTRALDGARRFGLERLRKCYARATQLDADFKNGTIKEREQALGALLLELMG